MSNTSQLDGEALLRIARAVERFDAAWRRGEPFPLEDLLHDATGLERDELLRHGLVVELKHRRRRGDSPMVSEYQWRFPEDTAILQAAFAESETIPPPPHPPLYPPPAAGYVCDRQLEALICAYLESQDRGAETPRLVSLHASKLRAVLQELIEDERALESWYRPLRAVGQTAGVGRFFGNYELLEEIGRGGQGVVYRARQVHINKEVALKLVNPNDRLHSLRELTIAGNLEHEHLVRV
jgi:hypothetical protein